MRTSAHRYQWGVCPRSNPLSFSRQSGPVSILRGNPPIRSLRNWQQPYGVVVLRQMNRFGASLNLFRIRGNSFHGQGRSVSWCWVGYLLFSTVSMLQPAVDRTQPSQPQARRLTAPCNIQLFQKTENDSQL